MPAAQALARACKQGRIPFAALFDELGYTCVDGMAIMSAQAAAAGRRTPPHARSKRAIGET